jgi:hypothetical protein
MVSNLETASHGVIAMIKRSRVISSTVVCNVCPRYSPRVRPLPLQPDSLDRDRCPIQRTRDYDIQRSKCCRPAAEEEAKTKEDVPEPACGDFEDPGLDVIPWAI